MIKTYLQDSKLNNTPFIDELAMPDGRISPQWEKMAAFYQSLDPAKMSHYYEDVSRQLRENGVTYNVFDDPDGMNRPWMLDHVPMIIGSDDWAHIERGLVQRAQLLNEILKDIYGSRQLIKNGSIPFELIYNHQGFLRQADKIRLNGEHQLIQYSADLSRGPDGKMWVLNDHTDSPSGSGYTFENRAAMTRVFPEMIRINQVRKISKYYQTLKETLARLSIFNKENPMIVMLSPGPSSPIFFEHAYLSSLLGFTLALGEDLTVSDGFVWLKTIKGLVKVDVIIRRVEDVLCDPLEFRNDSQLGVVGLMESVRQRKVLVINPLGTRILENPGLMAFLPKLCKEVMGEDLLLPSVATWWCGQSLEMNYVLENISSLTIRNIYRDSSHNPVDGGSLSLEKVNELRNEIKRFPFRYVGQEKVSFSTTPSWVDGSLQPRIAVLRSYIVADSINGEYQVMPGGLSRSFEEASTFNALDKAVGVGKDTWVLGKNPIAQITPADRQSLERSMPVMKNMLPSRTGERLFWLGRYLERSAYTVRLMRIVLLTYNEADEDIHITKDLVLSTLLKSLSQLTGTLPGFTKDSNLKNPEKELVSLATDVNKAGSLAQSVQYLLNNAYSVRDRLSLDTWRILDSIGEELNTLRNSGNDLTKIHGCLDNLIMRLMGFYGLNIDNMTREATWHLLNTGRFVESAINNATLLSAMLGKVVEGEVAKSLLEYSLRCNESLVTYRYRYRSHLEIKNVVELLVLSDDNPRSLVYQCVNIENHLSNLPTAENKGFSDTRKKLLEVITLIRLCDINKVAAIDKTKVNHQNLQEFLQQVINLLQNISDLIYENHFNHTGNRYGIVQSNSLPEI